MKDIQGNLHPLQGAGFDIVETFPLPASAWWDDYYRNTEKKAALLRSRHPDDPDVDRVCTAEEEEINIWRRFSDQYGYVFYTGRKR
jgi:serine/threonine-protein kinase HipA